MAGLGKPATLALGIVTMIGGVLVGLLVTIAGLISAFGDVAYVEAAARSERLSEGISTATLHGLVSGGGVALVGVALVVFGAQRAGVADRRRPGSAERSGSPRLDAGDGKRSPDRTVV